MARSIESQRQQWPHRVAQLSYEDAMAYIDQTLAEGEHHDSFDADDDGWHPQGLDQPCQTCGERAGEHHWDKSCPVYGRDANGDSNYDDLRGFNVTRFSHRRPRNRHLAFRCRIAMPMPTTLQLSNQPDYLGSHGMKVMQDDQGEWAFKQPKDKLQFTVPLEHAATSLQRQMGLEAPETHVIDHQGRPAVVSKWYPNSTQAFPQPPHLDELHPDDQMTIQKNHVLDWLIGNHDSHVGNWMRTEDGKLVSIDKGQAAKYFGHDRLDPRFHPNYYAREPIYNQLYRDHAKGRGQLHDPRTGELGAFVKQVQAIPDEHLKEMFRPYAEGAARSGLLANPDGDRDRRLGPRTLPANSPEHFLDALVQRKNNLHNDLGEYYDRMSPGRQLVGRQRSPMRTRFRLAAASGTRLWIPGHVAEHLGVPYQTMVSLLKGGEFPAASHTSNRHALMWDDIKPWEHWADKYQALGRQGRVPGWADEFGTDAPLRKLHGMSDLIGELGLPPNTVYHWFSRPNIQSRPPASTHYVPNKGAANGDTYFWESTQPIHDWYNDYKNMAGTGAKGLGVSNTMPGSGKMTSPARENPLCPNCFTQHAGECW